MPDVTIGGQTLHYEDLGGKGPAVVFNHSFGMNGSMFGPQIAAFKDTYRCVFWDQRAHGASPATAPFTFWDSARDALALLDRLGIEKSTFVGTSQGGFVALRCALLAPERVRAVAIMGSSAAAEDPAQKVAFEQLHTAFVGDGASPPPEPVIEAMAHICFGPQFEAESWKAVWRKWPAAQFSAAFRALADRDDIIGRLGEVRAPALVLHGTDDGSYAPAHGAAIAAGVANCKGFVLVDKGAHFLSLTHPEPVNAALAPFLAEYA